MVQCKYLSLYLPRSFKLTRLCMSFHFYFQILYYFFLVSTEKFYNILYLIFVFLFADFSRTYALAQSDLSIEARFANTSFFQLLFARNAPAIAIWKNPADEFQGFFHRPRIRKWSE